MKQCQMCGRWKPHVHNSEDIAEFMQSLTWQPIETAPFDGTPVLVLENGTYYPDENNIYIAEYRYEETITPVRNQRKAWYVQHTFQDEQGGEMDVFPSYWMPLPKPPNRGEKK